MTNMDEFYASPSEMNMPFHGAKLALYLGSRLAVILRDARPDIPFPGHWDLPGGGREGTETPVDCVLRETREELGLSVPRAALHWGRAFSEGARTKWFFVAHLPEAAALDVVFGDEGQRWKLMEEADFASHAKAVPQFRTRLQIYMQERDRTKNPPLL